MRAVGTMHPSLSIRAKIALGTGAVALVVWSMFAAFSYRATAVLLRLSSERVFAAATEAVTLEFQSAYRPVHQTATLLAHSRLVDAEGAEERLTFVPLLVEMLRSAPHAAAIQVGYGDGDYFIVRTLANERLRERFSAPAGAAFNVDHIDTSNPAGNVRLFFDEALDRLEVRELPPSNYDPRKRPWYLGALDVGETVASGPYVFFFMQEIGITVARATEDGRAVVAADVTLESISDRLAAQRITPSTEALLHIDGDVLAWSGELEPLVVTADGRLRQRTIAELPDSVLGRLATGETPEGWLKYRVRLDFAHGISPELILGVPEHELLAEFERARARYLLTSLALIGLLIPLSLVLANRISAPIRELHRAIARVGEGDFEFELPKMHSRDEVGELNLALATMRTSLQAHIEELAAATAARERLESELDIARRIQMNLVPGGGELRATLGNDQVYARLIPARAVGGDLYAIIELPDGHYFIAVGDVSDKGIPAALFVSRTLALVKMLVPRSPDLAHLLAELNDELADDNDSCMFITLFCAIVDPSAGLLRYACAGHNPPILVTREEARPLPLDSGAALGLFPGAGYTESMVQLVSGDRLVIYTDGITEAFDENRQQFSEERLLGVLNDRFESVELMGARVLDAVSAFAGDTPQSDDIALLILRRA